MTNDTKNINFLDHGTHKKMRKVGAGEHVWLYISLGMYIAYDEVKDAVHYASTSAEQLAEETGLTPKKIQKSIEALVNHGFIKIYPQGDGTNCYVLQQISIKAVRETARRFSDYDND